MEQLAKSVRNQPAEDVCVDWSKIDKKEYLMAMCKSTIDSTAIKALLRGALTDKINDREILMKGLDYSYYYERDD